jgi:hypothetical protein
MKIDLQEHWGNKELFHVPRLVSKIVQGMQTDGHVHLWTKEGKNGNNNGLYRLLDELCEYWGWNKSDITISHCTVNISYMQSEYKNRWIEHSQSAVEFRPTFPVYPWNKEKIYGMFIARADCSRIRAIHNHINFRYAHQGLTSFHQDLFEYMSYPDLVQYFMESGQTYEQMISVKPYSDIDAIKTPPITPGNDSINWGKVYQKIAIEVICETSTEPDSWDASEKVFRCYYYKRPFLLIGSPGNLEYLNSNFGHKSWEGIIPEDYDRLEGIARVDRVFEILDQLITENKFEEILEKSQDILEHNHKLFLKNRERWSRQNFERLVDGEE